MKCLEVSRGRGPLLLVVLLLWAMGDASPSTDRKDDGGQDVKLDLSSFRSGRQQFGSEDDGGGGGGGGGEMDLGLIDALQRWADALEAQITLMRTEMTEMRQQNRRLKEEAKKATQEADVVRREMSQLRSELRENQGEISSDNDSTERKVEALRDDLRVFSESFSDFLEHYDDTMREVRTNHTDTLGQIDWTKRSVKDLSVTLSSSLAEHNVETIRADVDELADRVAVLAQADYILEERIRHAENRTDARSAAVGKELAKLRSSIVAPALFKEAFANISADLADLAGSSVSNYTRLRAELRETEQTTAATMDRLASGLSAAEQKTDRLTQDVKTQARAFAEDFGNFQKSIDFAKTKYDELTATTDGLAAALKRHAEYTTRNLTRAVLGAVSELTGRVDAHDGRLAATKTDADQLNESLNTFVGQVGAEIIKLHTADEELNLRLEDAEAEIGIGAAKGKTSLGGGNRTSSSSSSLGERVSLLERGLTRMKGNELPLLLRVAVQAEANHTRTSGGLRSLEKHYIDMKRESFERNLLLVSLNDSVNSLGEAARGLRQVQDRMAEAQGEQARRTQRLAEELESAAGAAAAAGDDVTALAARAQRMAEEFSKQTGKHWQRLEALTAASDRHDEAIVADARKTDRLDSDVTALANRTAELAANFSRIVIFAAGNKAEVLELKVVGASLEDKLDRLYDLHHIASRDGAESAAHARGNLTRLAAAAAAAERDLDSMTARMQAVEQMMAEETRTTGELRGGLVRMQTAQQDSRATVETLKLDLETVKAEAAGVDSLVTSVQRHVASLTSNVTELSANLTRSTGEVRDLRDRTRVADAERKHLRRDVDANRRGLELADEQFQVLRLNSSTLKANIVGLGNYINNINGDVGKLASTFEKYIGELTSDADALAANVTSMEEAMESEMASIRAQVHAAEVARTDLKGEIAALTTKSYATKTSLFEAQNEVSSLRADQGNMANKAAALETQLSSMMSARESQLKELSSVKTDIAALRSGLTSLTNSMFNLKAGSDQAEALASMRDRLESTAADVTAVGREVSRIKKEFQGLGPRVQSLSGDVGAIGRSVSGLSQRVASVGDPPRFSCAVTSDEIRTSGVITYNICNVNVGGIMDRETGHVTVRQAGDYYVAFTGNMVSVNSQAVWCALYKQSAGNDGWQVLGMINNYQRNAGDSVDDRDSGALATIVGLDEGDQIWVEWRGYGESFLYSNPYRLISFTGFLLNGGGSGPSLKQPKKADDDSQEEIEALSTSSLEVE